MHEVHSGLSAPAPVACYLAHEPMESPEDAARLAHLLELSRTLGWREALTEVHRDHPSIESYITDPLRAAYLDLLPLTPESDVLEIGASMGQHTALIAPRVRSLSALEVVQGQAEFAAERCRQEGLTNVRVDCGGDDCRLPYGDAAFDVVILNLVFEWCGSRLPEGQVEGQQRLLREMARVLRPGGWLWLSTKNRYALRLLLGGRDEHLYDLRFGSALPRAWQTALLRRGGHDRPAGLLHSHDTLAGMLRTHGFDRLRSYWAAPEMRFPRKFVELNTKAVREARRAGGFEQGSTRLTRMLMPWVPNAWVKHFTPGLALLAQKGESPR